MKKLTRAQMIVLLRAAEHYDITSDSLVNAMAKLRDGLAKMDYANLQRLNEQKCSKEESVK